MSSERKHPRIPFEKIRTIPRSERAWKVSRRDFAKPLPAGAGVADLLDSLPRVFAADGLRERGHYRGHVAESSLYTMASLHPLATAALAAGATLAVASLLRPAFARKERHGLARFWH